MNQFLSRDLTRMTYGVEIECYQPCGLVEIGSWCDGILAPQLGSGWVAKSDSSLSSIIRRKKQDFEGVEFVSPILQKQSGLQEIENICRWLKKNNIFVSKSCGFHVHIGWPHTNMKPLQRLIWLVANIEDGLWAITGSPWRRKNAFEMSASLKENCRRSINKWTTNNIEGLANNRAFLNRYQVLNINNLVSHEKDTVEIRVFPGTTRPEKMLAWIQLSLALVQKAEMDKRRKPWDSVPIAAVKIRRKKKGYWKSEARRLLKGIGWTGKKGAKLGIFQKNLKSSSVMIENLLRLSSEFDYYQSKGLWEHIPMDEIIPQLKENPIMPGYEGNANIEETVEREAIADSCEGEYDSDGNRIYRVDPAIEHNLEDDEDIRFVDEN